MPINHPALLKAENEKLREALRWYEEKVAECRKIGSLGDNARQALDRDGGFRARDALSQQAEPTDTYTAVDMATAAAQGFRDGQAAMEPAPAKDEREAKAWPALAGIGRDSGHPRAVVLYLRHEPSDEHLRMIQEALRTRPAQTEQQPAYVECRECTDCGHVGINDAHQTDATCAMCDWSGPSPVEDQCPDCGNENVMGAACPKCSGRYRILAETHVAAPIAQTEQQSAQDEREAVKQAIAEALGDALDCTRVWSAWSYGTMRQDDFQLVAEDDGRLDEIADAAISAMTTRPAQTEQQSAQDEREAFEAWMVEVEGARIRPRFGRVTAGPFADEYRDGQIQGAWNVWQARAVRPAHTEQQPAIVKHSLTVEPVAYAVFADNGNVVCFSTQRDHPSLVALEADGHSVVSLAPIAQTSLPTQGAVEQ